MCLIGYRLQLLEYSRTSVFIYGFLYIGVPKVFEDMARIELSTLNRWHVLTGQYVLVN
jgi:hypothetical protein